jgi:hypothetical protein
MCTLSTFLLVVLAALLMLSSIVWAVKDARRRNKPPLFGLVAVLLFFPFGLLAWLLFRPPLTSGARLRRPAARPS